MASRPSDVERPGGGGSMTRVVALLVVAAIWIATRAEPAVWGVAPLLLAIAIILLTLQDRRAAG